MKKLVSTVGIAALAAVGALAPAAASHAADLGGWSETGTSVSGQTATEFSRDAIKATVNHRGAAEQKVISGTSNKRAHGWTTWSGVYHYTTAQLERGNGAVITSTGRKWGTSGTEAISAYKPFSPNAADSGWGHAKTYYGK